MRSASLPITKLMKEHIEYYPELFEYYPSNGIIEIYNCISRIDSDFESLLKICRFFAKQGSHCIILPKTLHHKSKEYHNIFGQLLESKYEGKCPDLLIDGVFYEHEGHISKNGRRAFRNMMNRGYAQSSRVIIDECGVTNSFILRSVSGKQKIGVKIDELWVLRQHEVELVYKSERQQINAAPVFNESSESLPQK